MRKLRLILLRHAEAESAQDLDSASDHARELTARGGRSAVAIGRRLAELGWIPDLGLVSDAVRAQATAKLAAEAFSELAWQVRDELYLSETSVLIDAIAVSGNPPPKTLIIVAHNPALSDAVTILSGERCHLAPADAALLSIEADSWQDAAPLRGSWELCGVFSPPS